MILNLSVPDETYLAYGEFKDYHRPHMAMQDTLKRFRDVNPADPRILVLTGPQRDALEKAAGGVSIETFDDLLRLVRSGATLKLDSLDINVPAEVLSFYLGNAEFLGRDPGEHVRNTVVELLRRGCGR